MTVYSISAVTLAVRDMARSVDFYQAKVGLTMLYGGKDAGFTSFQVGDGFLNLIAATDSEPGWWGRAIFYVDGVDNLYQRLLDAGVKPQNPPQDAPWRERFFHVNDPDGHELSFAAPLART